MPIFDLNPKEFARQQGIQPKTAYEMLKQGLREGWPFVIRTGIRTKKFPNGKSIRVSMELYEQFKREGSKS